MIEWTKIIHGECEKMDDVPKGAIIDCINDIECYGLCEGCNRPIMDGENHYSDENGILLCEKCGDEEIKLEVTE